MMYDALINGFAVALQPMNLLWALLGCSLGTAIGVLPGVTDRPKGATECSP